MNKKITAKKIAYTAVYIALIVVFTFTSVGFIPIIPGVIDTAFLLLVIVAVALQLEGFWTGLVCSTAFGICSFIKAYLYPSAMAFCFQNPLVSILPRIVIGFVGGVAFVFFKKLFAASEKKFVRQILPSAIAAAICVITNTVLVLSTIALLYGGRTITLSNGAVVALMQYIFGTIMIINFPVELLACLLLVPTVYAVLMKYRKKESAV